MSQPKHFFSRYYYKNDLDLLNTVINLYSIVELGGKLSDMEMIVMRYYLKSGYNEITKKTIMSDSEVFKTMTDAEKTRKHLNQINHRLEKKGFLERSLRNYREKKVSSKLLELKESFLTADKDKKASFYSIYFEKIT